ncbi:MAG: hypothetical protein EA374_08115 [Acholeplasmatales bacterium]|nr:MAG: hypothetical protein EA374_08115 [Acholeplasmatales bacterium]
MIDVRKILLMIILVTLAVLLFGCDLPSEPRPETPVPEGHVRLPVLTNTVQEEAVAILEDLGLTVVVQQRTHVERPKSRQFIEYGAFRQAGHDVPEGTVITIIVSKTLVDESDYFVVEAIPYDGPLLGTHFFDLPRWQDNSRYEPGDPSRTLYLGGGGAFSVDYNPAGGIGRCIDGDTTVFHYPEDIYSRIGSSAKSTRYLNIDTPETPSGREEPFGRQATIYVCNLLEEAESIVLQTDPGDYLTGNFERLLAWVWIMLPGEEDYFLLNYMIVRQGLGEVKYLFGAGETDITVYEDKTYTEWMFHAEALAREEGRGMFGDLLDWYWDYEQDRPYPGRW